jgi:osmoprotectant transport system substrate-binding protein
MCSINATLARLLGLAAVLSVVAAGCGGGGGGGGQGELSGLDIAVGSKEFTEQVILGQIAVLALENAGANVTDQTGLAGTEVARQALEAGEIGAYWEYTGTGWINFLGETEPIPDPQEQYQAVADRDLEENNIRWLEPGSANNVYGIAVRGEAQEELGVERLSDFNALIAERPEDATLCIASEFATRDDGLPGMEEAYGFEFPEENISQLDEGVIYNATDAGDPCNFGEVFRTDGRITGLDLALLEDDEGFFPIYNPSFTVRGEVFDQYPQIEDIFGPISAALTNEALQEMNAAVDVGGELEEDVAERFLRDNGFIG